MAERKRKVIHFPQHRPDLRREAEKILHQRWQRSKPVRIAAAVAILAFLSFAVVALFSPTLHYSLAQPSAAPITSEQFTRELQAITDSRYSRGVLIDPLANGDTFYSAEIDAINKAQNHVNIEAYIFQRGEIAQRILGALTERAKSGIQVRLVLDAMGSFRTPKKYFDDLRNAGGKVEFYHPLRWNTWLRSNNRTHRELMIIDGKVGFIGGAGIADHWYRAKKQDEPRWRDTMFRVQGEAVTALQGAFVENWLEASGEILSGDQFFPILLKPGSATTFVINSSPSQGGSTRARMLFQTMLASAKHKIDVATPYFLPDQSLRDELIRARRRGVRVRVIVPGRKSDHLMTRASSRRVYGDLLQAGVEIHEYRPSMIHTKILIIDDVWSIIGSTNFDNRSFGINDEVNLAAMDPQVAAALTQQYEQDIAQSDPITYDQWKNRPIWERAVEWAGWISERQQ